MTPNVKLVISFALNLEKPLQSEVVKTSFNLAMSRDSCQLTDVEQLWQVDLSTAQLRVFGTGVSRWEVGTLERL